MKTELTELEKLIADTKEMPLAVFGHKFLREKQPLITINECIAIAEAWAEIKVKEVENPCPHGMRMRGSYQKKKGLKLGLKHSPA